MTAWQKRDKGSNKPQVDDLLMVGLLAAKLGHQSSAHGAGGFEANFVVSWQ